jgi:SAM-dependent methyltransferase
MTAECRVVAGVDPSLEMLRASADPFCALFDGASVPMKSGSVDFAYASCVFHHVHPSARGGVLREIWRVLKPGGYFFMIEHNLSNPLTRRLLQGCAMDADAQFFAPAEGERMLDEAGFESVASRHLVFSPAPSLPVFRSLESLFEKLPIGAQYATFGRKPF